MEEQGAEGKEPSTERSVPDMTEAWFIQIEELAKYMQREYQYALGRNRDDVFQECIAMKNKFLGVLLRHAVLDSVPADIRPELCRRYPKAPGYLKLIAWYTVKMRRILFASE
jgi:hypothetical protein